MLPREARRCSAVDVPNTATAANSTDPHSGIASLSARFVALLESSLGDYKFANAPSGSGRRYEWSANTRFDVELVCHRGRLLARLAIAAAKRPDAPVPR